MIRVATIADVPVIARLGEQFHREAAWADIVSYNAGDCAQSLAALIQNGIVLVCEEAGEVIGIAGGVICPIYFNHNHLTGEELFLWMKPDRRGHGAKLLRALEQAARDRGCQSWGMKSLATVNPDRMDRFYARKGYRASERSYIKRL